MITDLTKKLDKLFHDRIRLGAMSMLAIARDGISFSELVHELDVTRGNLSAHMKALESAGLVEIKKEFVDNKPRTTYYITDDGSKAFNDYLDLLERIVKHVKG